MTEQPQPSTEIPDEDRVSLAPLDPEDALRALLAVDPNAKTTSDEPDDEPNTGDA